MSISNWASSGNRGRQSHWVETLGRICLGFRWLEKCCTCALVRAELPLAVVAERLLGLDGVPGGVGLECPGDSRDVGHLGGRVSQRGRPTLQQELSVVDDPGACRSEEEKKADTKSTMNEMKVMTKIKYFTSLTSNNENWQTFFFFKKQDVVQHEKGKKNWSRNAQRSSLLVTRDLFFLASVTPAEVVPVHFYQLISLSNRVDGTRYQY